MNAAKNLTNPRRLKSGRNSRDGKLGNFIDRPLKDNSANAVRYDEIVSGVASDLGGRPTALEMGLIRQYAVARLMMEQLNIPGGEVTNEVVSRHSHAVSTMLKISSALGMVRRDRTRHSPYLKKRAKAGGC